MNAWKTVNGVQGWWISLTHNFSCLKFLLYANYKGRRAGTGSEVG